MKKFFVYVLECRDGTLYTGHTNDLARRMMEHRLGRGAKYTKARGVRRLRAFWEFKSRRAAAKEEARIKRLPRSVKLFMIGAQESLFAARRWDR